MLTCVSAGAVVMLSSVRALQAPNAASNMPAPGSNTLPATCFARVSHHPDWQSYRLRKLCKHARITKHLELSLLEL